VARTYPDSPARCFGSNTEVWHGAATPALVCARHLAVYEAVPARAFEGHRLRMGALSACSFLCDPRRKPDWCLDLSQACALD
jgi:hypothetical protein